MIKQRMFASVLGRLLKACLLLCAFVVAPLTSAESLLLKKPKESLLVVIIDDIGDNHARGLQAVNLPGPLTYAFLPHTPFAKELAKKAHQQGKDVILHAPMENKAGLRLGPGALEQHHSRTEIKNILSTDLDAIPHVIGMNNHMGSLLTEDRGKMHAVMDVVKQRNLFFIDSVTSTKTVAWRVAREQGIPHLTRDVFLDNKQEWNYINGQFKKALQVSIAQGYAVLIGHPYPETVEYLAQALPLLDQLGIKLVSASELLEISKKRQIALVDR